MHLWRENASVENGCSCACDQMWSKCKMWLIQNEYWLRWTTTSCQDMWLKYKCD